MRERGLPGSFWPEPTQRALLQVVLGPAEEAGPRWRALQPLDVTALPLGSFGLLPPLYERLAQVAPHDPQLPLLQGTHRSTWFRNQVLLEQLPRLLSALRDRGVEALLVGGAAAAARWYAPGLRPVRPLELIVPAAHVPVAREACAAAGWRPAGRHRSFVRFVGAGNAPLIVHSDVPAPLAGRLGTGAYDVLRASAVDLPALPGGPLVLDVADELLLICATGARSAMRGSCQWLIDVHGALSSEAPPQADVLVARARRFGVAEALRATLAYLADVSGSALVDYDHAVAGIRGTPRERLAFLLSAAPSGRLAGAGDLLASHVRASAGDPLARVAAGLPRHLQEAWETEGLAETLGLALRKAVRRVRAQAGPSARNRSASS